MKNLSVLILCSIITACSSTPKVLPYQKGTYMVSNETEFDVTSMVNEVHETAHEKCSAEGKEIEILKTESGHAGVGAFGPKKGFGIIFRCI